MKETTPYTQKWYDIVDALDKANKELDDMLKKSNKYSPFSNVEIDAKGLEVVPQEVTNKYLKAMQLLGEDGQKTFWDAVGQGDSYEVAFNKATGKYKEIEDYNKKLKDSTQKVGGMATAAGQAFSALGNAFEIPALNVAGVVAQSVANIALAFGDALAKDQTSKLNIFAFIGAAISSVATLAALVSQVKNITKYAGGGVINGPTTIGDYNIARVNSGEMIFNTRQQARLWNMINHGVQRPNMTLEGGKVKFEIQGQKLVGVMSNYNKKMNKAY